MLFSKQHNYYPYYSFDTYEWIDKYLSCLMVGLRERDYYNVGRFGPQDRGKDNLRRHKKKMLKWMVGNCKGRRKGESREMNKDSKLVSSTPSTSTHSALAT